MGQNISCTPFERFPENFSKYPPSWQFCKGPGLMTDVDSKVADILPKCFEGAQIKLRKKISGNLTLGTNVILSSVTPSGGQLASEYRAKKTEFQVCLAPSGAFALQTTFQIRPSVSLILDTQLQGLRNSVGSANLVYSKNKTTAAVIVSGCSIPSKKSEIDGDLLPLLTIDKNFFMSAGFQILRKVGSNWLVGGQFNIDMSPRLAICHRLLKSSFGAVVDKSWCQLFCTHRLNHRAELAGRFRSRWNGSECWASVGGMWQYSGSQVRASYSTDGLVACTLRRSIIFNEETHFALLLSGLFNHWNNKFRLGMGFDVFV